MWACSKISLFQLFEFEKKNPKKYEMKRLKLLVKYIFSRSKYTFQEDEIILENFQVNFGPFFLGYLLNVMIVKRKMEIFQ